jgi:hypothetical protein
LRFIKRNVKTNSIKTNELAYMYKTYVRPKVEYCSVVWDPWQKQQINQIEMIQRRATRYTLNQYSYHSSVSAMLQHLCWLQRRNLASVTMLYKLQHQLVSISNLHYLVPPRDHKFIQPFSPTNYHLYSFFPRTIRLWNSLPNQVANSPDLDAFKSGAQLISLRLVPNHSSIVNILCCFYPLKKNERKKKCLFINVYTMYVIQILVSPACLLKSLQHIEV